ncbi:FAD-dependent oxidoreductase [Nocardioides jejuensis]|uniref:ferredoxin--NADP(+) reductase n=1 Tax=Nocardioides jejuensis TaxID=2502782 RepID=A0A4R1CJE8_9ACTN|nr:FAD-dependent oxidoreductase [Nocardioides jejuensis]TCJ31201.1 pyridine nucleotide-disulfide oxidoreductase [Nocardioides jejuensis]
MTLRVAVVGGGPAGIYAADILTKSDVDVSVDIIERLPAPFGLVRYGVAPDHPRIKEIIKALDRVLDKPEIRFLGNVNFGTDVKLEELQEFYDAVIFSTGAKSDRDLGIPGEEHSIGAADFVSWYDAHPDDAPTWDFEGATRVAVLGVGNVALDVARVLAKTADEMLVTDIPAQVFEGLKTKQITDVHVFSRRGPAYAKFSPLELRELNHSPNVEVVVHPEGFDVDADGMEHIGKHKSQKMVLDTLANWVGRDEVGKPHRIHLHFMEQPAEVVTDADGKVVAFKTERTHSPNADGTVEGTGEITEWPVGQVYRAIGYKSDALPGLPWDERKAVIPNDGGKVLDLEGNHIPGVFTTGWIKRGPVGLIGHTKSDAAETVGHLLELTTETAPQRSDEAVDAFFAERGANVFTHEHWLKLNEHEIALGEAQERLRVKVPTREGMLDAGQS